MSLFAIGDFHLSGEPPAKPMEVFSPNWENHFEKIRRNWLTKITETDTVIICGDTSWAMSLEAAMQDLNRIAALPGQKIILRGNHDYWWTSLKKCSRPRKANLCFYRTTFLPAAMLPSAVRAGGFCRRRKRLRMTTGIFTCVKA